MTLNLDTNFIESIPGLTMNQLVFLALVLDKNQNKSQDISQLLSLVNEVEVQELIEKGYVEVNPDIPRSFKKYSATKLLKECRTNEETWFEQFFETYPTYVTRPDGTDDYLRGNKKKCHDAYSKYVQHSPINHNFLMKCLTFDVQNKMSTGKYGYMKTMHNWLISHEYEKIEEQMNGETQTFNNVSYGRNLL